MPDDVVMPEGQPAVRVTAMPANSNVYGDIFDGWLMAQMDLAASSVASLHARGRAVTISVEGMAFHRPVFTGDEVSVFGRLVKVVGLRCMSRSKPGHAIVTRRTPIR